MGATGLSLAGGMPPALASSGYDPRRCAEGQVKLNATLDGSPAFWSYTGVIYAVLPNARPIPILALSGCQANWAVRQSDDSFQLAAPLLSFFCDINSKAFLTQFDNPWTSRHNEVRPNLFAGSGRAIYPADGTAMRLSGAIAASESAPHGFTPGNGGTGVGRVEWSLTRDTIVLTTDQFFDVKTQPQGEAQTRTADRAGFFDSAVSRLPARFAATTISPWLGWMQMGEAAGHLVWHTSGEKVFSIDEVPELYRTHAGKLLEHLVTRPPP